MDCAEQISVLTLLSKLLDEKARCEDCIIDGKNVIAQLNDLSEYAVGVEMLRAGVLSQSSKFRSRRMWIRSVLASFGNGGSCGAWSMDVQAVTHRRSKFHARVLRRPI